MQTTRIGVSGIVSNIEVSNMARTFSIFGQIKRIAKTKTN